MPAAYAGVLCPRQCSSARSNVVATAGQIHTLIVNGKGDLYITSGGERLSNLYRNIAPEPQSTLRLIFSQPTANRILEISANFYHAAFVTESGQVFIFGSNNHCCCGVGLESDQEILKPILVIALEMTPCQQVMTGFDFTIALTRSGALYSWGSNSQGQLGHGHTLDEPRPHEIIVESDNGAPDPVVQVSTTIYHVAAVTKAGRLLTWGCGWHGCLGHNYCCNELPPKRVEHGGFAGLFIVCASLGNSHSAAIDASGLVVACDSPIVVLDNGQVHYFGTSKQKCYTEDHSGPFTIKGHKIQSIASGFYHNIMVTMKGVVFGFGWNGCHQLGVVDPSALSGDTILTPTEVFVAITKFERAPRLPDGN